MRVSAIESIPVTGEMGAVRRSGYDLRPVVLASSFVALYAALDWGAYALGPSSPVSHVHLPAGLSFALLLAYGLRYSPVVLVTALLDALWFHPTGLLFPVAAGHCLATTLIQVAAAAILRYASSGHVVNLKYGRDVAKFMISGVLLAAALAGLAAALDYGGPSPGATFIEFLRRNLVGYATGIFAVTPFLLIHAGPWLDKVLVGINGERGNQSQYLLIHRMDRPATVFALSFVGVTGVVFWLILVQGVYGGLPVFLLFSLPLIWVSVNRGLEGLSIAIPFLVGINLVAPWRLDLPAESSGALQMLLVLALINACIIGAGVTQVRVTDRQIERRDAILDAVSYAAQQFLGKGGWENGLQEVMRRLGDATSVTRVFITERKAREGGQAGDPWLHEWSVPGVALDENDRRVLNLLRGQLIEEHVDRLTQGEPCLLLTKGIVAKKREMLEALGVRSAVIVPMFVDRQLWGCLGLEQCFTERDWPASEIDGLKMAGQILGTLVASVRVEQQFRQLTGNIQAVFWISNADGHSKQYVSPGYEEIWGRTCTSLQRQPVSWLEAVHPEDHSRVCDSLVKQAWGEYDEEYRVVRPDQSTRWVRDRAFPIRNQTGQVYRIVGIAEDITKHKKTEEQLRAATVLLSSLIDHLQSGVVVEDEARHITHVNQAFNSMFSFPIPSKSLFGIDSRLLFLQPPEFARRIEEIIEAGTPVMREELQWQGRVFMRDYVPLSIGENYHYHLWQYRDVTVSRHAEEQIKGSLKEKEVLLKEIHHRVKNNLQIICSLLNLQSNEIEDPKASQKFKESQDRVKAMALIHERLYQSGDLARIDFAGYVRNLTGHLLRSYKVSANAIRLNLEIDSVPMNLDVAIPCGLMINELVSNSLKYAFPKGKSGEIVIRFAEENGQGLRLTVEDNGIGMPGNANPEDSESLGLKLVRSLTDQLGGAIAYRSQEGFQCDIRIPRQKA